MAALTVTNCCSSFDASPFNADTMFIGPPAAIYHTKSSKHEVLTFRDLARGNNMKSKPVGNQVSIACAVRAAWECESPFGCGRISRIDECVPVGGLRDLAKQAVYRPDRDRAQITLSLPTAIGRDYALRRRRNGNGCASNLLRGVQNRAFASSALRGSLTTYGWPHDTNDSGSDEYPTSG